VSWLRLPHSMCIDSRYDQCTRYCGTSGKTSLVESLSTVALAFLRMGKLHTTRLRRRERSIVWPLMPQEDSMPSQFKQQRPRPLRNGTRRRAGTLLSQLRRAEDFVLVVPASKTVVVYGSITVYGSTVTLVLQNGSRRIVVGDDGKSIPIFVI